MMRKLKRFVEELDMEGLSGIPGQGGRLPGEGDYLSDAERRAKQRLGIAGQREGDPRAIGRAMQVLMQASGEFSRLSSGHESQLEELAKRIIYQYYKEIIDYFGIRLDLKIVTHQQLGRESRQTAFRDPRKVKKYDPVKDKDKKPVVKARAVDFGLLLHEAVKGIYIVLYRQAIPVDSELARKLRDKFGIKDEPGEWKYGPEIAADLRDFVNENELVDKYPNLREFLFYEMCNNLSADEFVSLMRGILSKTPEARFKIDNMIKSLYKRLDSWRTYQQELEEYNRQLEEYNRKMAKYEQDLAEWEKSRSKSAKPAAIVEPEDEDDMYNTMSKKQIEVAIDDALDNEDYQLARKLADIKLKNFGD